MSEIHIRHIKKALEEKFTGLIDLTDWESASDDARHAAFLSRALAAYVVGELVSIEPPSAAGSVTDGGDDNGIDAIYFDPTERRVVIVQSKWDSDGRGSPAVADVEKLLQGFRDLINARFDRFNAKIQTRRAQLETALDDPNVTFLLVFAHTGQEALSDHATRLLEDLLAEVNDTTEVVAFRLIRQPDLHGFVKGELEGESITLEVILHDWGSVQEAPVAYYGQIQAEDVAAWWEEHGSHLFSKNLRKFIPDSDVNDAITNSLLSEPEKFWYFNNGITVLADTIAKKPIGGGDRRSGAFVCEGVTIVNGAQTVGCIGAASRKDAEAVAKARVPIRFISLEEGPAELAGQVTRATNTQNRIERRDFVSLDPEQERLRMELLLEDGKVYTLKTGEPDPAHDTGCSVTEATVALACAQEDPALAVQAKREIGRLWEDISKAPYKQLFNSSVSGLRLWRSVDVMREVDRALRAEVDSREGRARGVAVHGNRLVLHLVFRGLPVGDFASTDLDFEELKRGLQGATTDTLDKVTELVELHYPNNYVASLFKNATRCRYIADEARKPSGEPDSESSAADGNTPPAESVPEAADPGLVENPAQLNVLEE
jgi:hypothetical protein